MSPQPVRRLSHLCDWFGSASTLWVLATTGAHVKAQLLRSNDSQLFDRPRCLSLNMCEKPAICSLTHFTVPPAKKMEPLVANGRDSELNAQEEGRTGVAAPFGPDSMWRTRLQKRYLPAQRHTCLWRCPRTSTSRSDPWPPGRPDGVSLVPFDSPDPPVSARRIDFLPEEVAARLLLAPPLKLSRGQPSDGGGLDDLQSPSTVLRCPGAALSVTRQLRVQSGP